MSQSSSGSDLDYQYVLPTLSESSQVGEARRAAVAMAARLGFDETDCGKTALIVTEAGSNILKHAGAGSVIIRGVQKDTVGSLEIIALDKGPGMSDPDRCFRDGFSTSGTPGTGLGAIRRLSSAFDLYSRAQAGTALVARLWPRQAAQPVASDNGLEVGALCLAKAGELVAGDGWALEKEAGSALILMADGLGHGDMAATAARAAARIFRTHRSLDPVVLVQRIHDGLRGTRGAAVAVARLDLKTRQVQYVGVGNISAAVIAGTETRRMVSHNGTAGAEARKIQEFVYPFPEGALLFMHSDGVATHWSLDAYPGLILRDPALIAGVLYRDFTRGRDDATVLVVRESPAEAP